MELSVESIQAHLNVLAPSDLPDVSAFGRNTQMLIILPTRDTDGHSRNACNRMCYGDLRGPWRTSDAVNLFPFGKPNKDDRTENVGQFVFHESKGGLLWHPSSGGTEGPFTGRQVIRHHGRLMALVQEGPRRSFLIFTRREFWGNTFNGTQSIKCQGCSKHLQISTRPASLRCPTCGVALRRETWKEVIDQNGSRLF